MRNSWVGYARVWTAYIPRTFWLFLSLAAIALGVILIVRHLDAIDLDGARGINPVIDGVILMKHLMNGHSSYVVRGSAIVAQGSMLICIYMGVFTTNNRMHEARRKRR